MVRIEHYDKLYQVTERQVGELFDVLQSQTYTWLDSREKDHLLLRRNTVLEEILHQRIVEEEDE